MSAEEHFSFIFSLLLFYIVQILQLFCTQAAVILSATTFARNFCLPLPVTVPH
ncbi:hypothetical protein [Phascolarctobacterium faecium]|uniref:hypothetical protein n=1 Tax=Phascolarctobacterium faecium TaxID=33025 RepID=UPI0024326F56|nr:hypothetical protein [Phascolarctobacterium faecium]